MEGNLPEDTFRRKGNVSGQEAHGRTEAENAALISLESDTDLHRLYSAINASRQALEPFRKTRTEMIREFVGSRYNENGARFPVLVNLLAMTAEAYTMGLVANNPKVKITTPHKQLWPFARRWEVGITNLLKEIHFADTLQKIVLDAFFTIGVAKIYHQEWNQVLIGDEWVDPGRPFVDHVSVDDFGMDMSVRDISKCRYMWDEYRVPWQALKDDPDMDPKVIDRMAPTSKHDRGEETARDITSGDLVDDDELEPMVDLMDVWLPDLGVVATFPRHVQGSRPLKVVDSGYEGGPYRVLTFSDVPDNVMPSSPAQQLIELHELYNGLVRKQARQAKRQKTNPIYRPNASEDANRLKKYSDGEWVKVQDPKAVGVIQQGGVDQSNVAFSMSVFDLFDRQAGNLSAMLGLGPQASTLGQEQLIYQSVSRKEAKMQSRVHAFTASVIEALGMLMWNDVMLEIPSSVDVSSNGLGVYVDMSWTPETREGDFWQYNFDIHRASMNYESPQVRMQKMEAAVAQILQMYPILQASGGTIDVQELVKQIAESRNIPELENVVTFSGPPAHMRPGPQGETSQVPQMPQQTTRNYVRRNVPTGGTPQARSMAMQDVLLNAGRTNQQQRNVLARPAG